MEEDSTFNVRTREKWRQASCRALAALAFITLTAAPLRAAPIAGYNVGISADQNFIWGPSDGGWFYTPTTSYTLAGIATSFAVFGTAPRDVVVGLYDGLPSAGGHLLGGFSLTANTSPGVWVSGDFAAPIALTAGEAYFLDFSHLGALNVAAPAAGAGPVGFNPAGTALSPFYFDQLTQTPGEDSNLDIFSEPLLQFMPATESSAEGVPEPAPLAMLTTAFLTLLLFRRRSAGT
jgi:hypothetical protein